MSAGSGAASTWSYLHYPTLTGRSKATSDLPRKQWSLPRDCAPLGCSSYHNHSHELERYGDLTGLETLFAGAPADALNAELDTYWLQHGGANPSAWIRR